MSPLGCRKTWVALCFEAVARMAVSRQPHTPLGGGSKQLIPGFLARVRGLLYRHEARRAVLYALAATLGLAVVLPLLGYMFGASRATAIAVLSAGGLLAAGVLLGAAIVGFL